MASLLFEFYLKWAKELGTAWYRSKEPIPIVHPFVGDGYLSNKKWPLIEECTKKNSLSIVGNIHSYDNLQINSISVVNKLPFTVIVQEMSEHLIRLQQVSFIC